jgi:NAD+ synthase
VKILTRDQAMNISRLAQQKLYEYVIDSKIKSLVLGISGGIDSAVVSEIGQKAATQLAINGHDIKLHYIFLDVESHRLDYQRAQELATSQKFQLEETDLTKWYQSSPLLWELPTDEHKAKVMKGNIKCRLRMIALYNYAKKYDGVVLDTDDLSEYYMGFWTKHGDEGDIKIIQNLTKDEVYDMGEFYRFPVSIQYSSPGDGLGVSANNLAQDQLQLPYMEIDYIISRFLQNGFDTNGDISQISTNKYFDLANQVSLEIKRTQPQVLYILTQSLNTGFKRRYGENVVNLFPTRLELGLPTIGTQEFNNIYLKAIQSR